MPIGALIDNRTMQGLGGIRGLVYFKYFVPVKRGLVDRGWFYAPKSDRVGV